MNHRETLGWREWVSFPELGIPRIKAKVDTGARTSCLHAFKVDTFERDSAPWVRFHIHPQQGNADEVVICEAPLVDQRTVRDSGGHEELRHVILTTLVIGDRTVSAELTLTDRDLMSFRVLVGRSAIRRQFVVDPGRSYLSGNKPPRTGSPRND
ncbi:MAG: hypothetical protein ACI9GW_002955 [Halieaceae bacterium]|jgi:hypothetical protein